MIWILFESTSRRTGLASILGWNARKRQRSQRKSERHIQFGCATKLTNPLTKQIKPIQLIYSDTFSKCIQHFVCKYCKNVIVTGRRSALFGVSFDRNHINHEMLTRLLCVTRIKCNESPTTMQGNREPQIKTESLPVEMFGERRSMESS